MRAYHVVLCLILLPATMALSFQLDNLTFVQNDITVEQVSLENPRVATMYFNVSPDSFNKVKVDPSSLNQYNPVTTLQPSDCDEQCTVENVMINSSSGTIPVEIYNGSEVNTTELEYSFAVDNTAPVVNDITTKNGGGVIGPESQILFDVSKGPFNNGFIFYDIDVTGGYMVDTCSGGTCTGRVTQSCTDGEQVTVAVADKHGVKSQDDAGNPVNEAESVMEETFTCDSTKPEITNVTVSAGGDSAIETGETVEVTVNVSDANDVTTRANFRALTGEDKNSTATCTKSCTLTFTAQKPGYKRVDQTIYVKDQAGNTKERTVTLEILESQASEGSLSDIWSVSSVQTSPSSISRKVLEYYSQPLYVRARFAPAVGDTRILDQQLNSCTFMNVNAEANYQLVAQGEKAGVRFEVPIDLWDANVTELRMNCTVSHKTRAGNAVVDGRETDTFTFKTNLAKTPDVPALIRQELNRSVSAKRQKYRKILQTTQKAMNTFTGICRASQILSASSGAASSAGGAVCAISNIPGLQGLRKTGRSLVNLGKGLGKGASEIQKSLGKFCNFLTCKTGWPVDLSGVWDSRGGPALEEHNFSQGQLLRPEDNIVTSMATLCLPGIVSNLRQAEQIRCEYERCLRQDALQRGMPASTCYSTMKQNRCRFWTKQLTKGALDLTGLGIYQGLIDKAERILKNPAALAGTAISAITNSLDICNTNQCEADAACIAPKLFSTMSDINSLLSTIKSTRKKFSQSKDASLCQYMQNARDTPLKPTIAETTQKAQESEDNICRNGVCNSGGWHKRIDGRTNVVLQPVTAESEYQWALKEDGEYHGVNIESQRVVLSDEDIDEENVNSDKQYVEWVTTTGQRVGDEKPKYIATPKGESAKPPEELQEDWEEYKESQKETEETSERAVNAREVVSHNEKVGLLNSNVQIAREEGGLERFETREAAGQWISENFDTDYYPKLIECLSKGQNCEGAVEQAGIQREKVPKPVESDSTWQWGRWMEEGLAFGGLAQRVWPHEASDIYPDWLTDKMYQVFGELSASEQAADAVCNRAFDLDAPDGTRVRTDGELRTGLHIEGYRQGNESGYTYKVTGMVAPPNQGSMNFDILLRGDGTTTILQDQELSAGNKTFAITSGNPVKVNSTNAYTEVCYGFNSAAPPYTQLGSTFCNKVITQ